MALIFRLLDGHVRVAERVVCVGALGHGVAVGQVVRAVELGLAGDAESGQVGTGAAATIAANACRQQRGRSFGVEAIERTAARIALVEVALQLIFLYIFINSHIFDWFQP